MFWVGVVVSCGRGCVVMGVVVVVGMWVVVVVVVLPLLLILFLFSAMKLRIRWMDVNLGCLVVVVVVVVIISGLVVPAVENILLSNSSHTSIFSLSSSSLSVLLSSISSSFPSSFCVLPKLDFFDSSPLSSFFVSPPLVQSGLGADKDVEVKGWLLCLLEG